MKLDLLAAAYLWFIVLALPMQPVDRKCKACGGDGWRSGWTVIKWWDVRILERCDRCDKYGKERTIYGGLLK